MPTFNPSRPPGHYPAHFHAVLRGPGGPLAPEAAFDPVVRQLAAGTGGREEARRIQRKWNSFIASLRASPSHPSSRVLEAWDCRLHFEHFSSGFWECFVVKRRRLVVAAVRNALQKTVDSPREL